jgi:hypothetical protein
MGSALVGLLHHMLERLRSLGLAYIHFALSDPGWFELTCLSQEEPPDDGSHVTTDDPVSSPHQLLLDALDEMVHVGVLTSHRRVDAEWSCWSAIQPAELRRTRWSGCRWRRS